jgi:hypothetical protein
VADLHDAGVDEEFGAVFFGDFDQSSVEVGAMNNPPSGFLSVLVLEQDARTGRGENGGGRMKVGEK